MSDPQNDTGLAASPNPAGDGVFNDSDMLKTNLNLQCRDAGIRFTCL